MPALSSLPLLWEELHWTTPHERSIALAQGRALAREKARLIEEYRRLQLRKSREASARKLAAFEGQWRSLDAKVHALKRHGSDLQTAVAARRRQVATGTMDI